MLGTGQLSDDLYLFHQDNKQRHAANQVNRISDSILHKRLGHIPFAKLHSDLNSYIPSLSHKQHDQLCNVCPRAKQTRLPFNDSSSTTTKLFDLIHVDI